MPKHIIKHKKTKEKEKLCKQSRKTPCVKGKKYSEWQWMSPFPEEPGNLKEAVWYFQMPKQYKQKARKLCNIDHVH